MQYLFDRADWLATRSVYIELMLVKGHKNSKSNTKEDEAAKRGLIEHQEILIRRGSLFNIFRAEIPAVAGEAGEVIAVE